MCVGWGGERLLNSQLKVEYCSSIDYQGAARKSTHRLMPKLSIANQVRSYSPKDDDIRDHVCVTFVLIIDPLPIKLYKVFDPLPHHPSG